ncbi:hypothetical protein GWI33_005259 [Rhynchophorus ferrugineus]|uniref:Uncharacterized protein n=1 Tax=Rhynchophorus ferrugineus TaxID=354439 RepID=A0A834IW74_RHYFE|nr:hypothetical protein GWI33_005259 [Rhynchophorus ferrugineus]
MDAARKERLWPRQDNGRRGAFPWKRVSLTDRRGQSSTIWSVGRPYSFLFCFAFCTSAIGSSSLSQLPPPNPRSTGMDRYGGPPPPATHRSGFLGMLRPRKSDECKTESFHTISSRVLG